MSAESSLVLHEQTRRSLADFKAKPSHAVLLDGPRGIGLTTIGRQLAADLLNIPVDKLSNQPYFRMITPEKSVITIEQVRNLQSFLRLKVPTTQQVSRIIVFDNADTMQTAAQNALLKMLEEPPEGTTLILLTNNSDLLLPTILSRVMTLTLKQPTTNDVVQHFITLGYTSDAATKAYTATDGSIIAAKALLQNDQLITPQLELARKLLASTAYERLTSVEQLSKDRQTAIDLVNALAQIGTVGVARAATGSPTTIKRWYGVLAAARTADDALARNANVKLVLIDLLLTL